MSYNLYLDDFREPRDSFYYTKLIMYNVLEWKVVRSYDDFVRIIEGKGIPEIISFDHDLADEHYDPDLYGSETFNEIYDGFEFKTGYDCAKWLVNYCIDNNIPICTEIYIHSMNPSGSNNIKSIFDTYFKQKGLNVTATISTLFRNY